MLREWSRTDAARVLRAPTAADDKYSRGVLGMHTGSSLYPGAAVLGVEAAWRTGVGLVQFTGAAAAGVLARRPETITVPGRVQAWVIGSGMDAQRLEPSERDVLTGILNGAEPVVVDAGALELARGAHAPLILTPHGRELDRLRAQLELPAAGSFGSPNPEVVIETARMLGAVVVGKGSQTVIADPRSGNMVVDSGTPWLATAGTGDVLAGVIGAVVAGVCACSDAMEQRPTLAEAAATGVWLHGRAATLAARRYGPTGGPITALEVAEHVPYAVAEVACP